MRTNFLGIASGISLLESRPTARLVALSNAKVQLIVGPVGSRILTGGLYEVSGINMTDASAGQHLCVDSLTLVDAHHNPVDLQERKTTISEQLAKRFPAWNRKTCNSLASWLRDVCKGKKKVLDHLAKHPYEPVRLGIYTLLEATQLVESTGAIDRAGQILGVAGVLLHEAAQNGHTYMALSELGPGIKANLPALAQGELPVSLLQIESVLDLHPKTIVQDRRGRFYLPELKRAEEDAAKWLARAIAGNAPLSKRFKQEDFLPKAGQDTPFPYTTEQCKAVASILTSTRTKLHIVTGGPGTGKTAVMRLLAAVSKKQGVNLAFAAPTGMAAKVLSGRLADTGNMATTVHHLLDGSGAHFGKNESNPLDLDLLVIDEASMLDLELLANVIRALPGQAHLLLVGDDDQLLSVGPGQVLADCKAIDQANVHTLNKPHRSHGAIQALVEQVEAGSFEVPNASNVVLNDCFVAPEFETQFLTMRKKYGPHRVGVILPFKGGDEAKPYRGVAGFNSSLQVLVNPEGSAIAGTTLRVADRVIVRANMYAPAISGDGTSCMTYVANGDRGSIASTDAAGNLYLQLDASPEQLCRIDGQAAAKHIELGYASTIHLAQGSEFSCVFVVMQGFASDFLNRSMLFTAISRAREELVIYGERKQLNQIARRQSPVRRSGLLDRLQNLKNNHA